jgi:hypothetical protein
MFGEWTKVVKTNEKMKSKRYFFKSSRRNHDYAPNRNLKRGHFTKEQVQETSDRHRKSRNQVLKKRIIVLFISLILFIGLLYILNERIFF